MNNDNPGSGFTGLASLSPAAAAAAAVGATILALFAGYLLVRDVPIRKVSG